MGQIENPALAVVELAGEQEQACHPEGDVAGADDDLGARVLRKRGVQLLEESLRAFQMLDHVEQQDVIELGEVDGRQSVVQVVQVKLVELDSFLEREDVDSDDVASLLAQLRAHPAARATDVQHARPRGTCSSTSVCGLS